MDVADWATITVASLAGIATFMSAAAAWKMVSLERFREKNRILLLKHQSEAEHLEKLIASFAKVIALASLQWSHERNNNIDKTTQEIQLHVSVLEALNTKISTDITGWVQKSDQDGNSFARTVYFVLGQLHTLGTQDKEFLVTKTEELKEIQDKLYSEMSLQ